MSTSHLSPADNLWHVPVILVYPGVGTIGPVGEIVISATVETVVSHTPLAEMKQTAQELYTAHRDAIAPPPFQKQETPYSCIPACLRMVLGSFGMVFHAVPFYLGAGVGMA